MRNTNDLLNAACYWVITKHEQKSGTPPSGVQFNKYLSILNKETGDLQSPLALPHVWYRWGDEVVRLHMPSRLDWNHEDPPRTSVQWVGDTPESAPETAIMRKVYELVEKLTDEYSQENSLPSMIGRVYAYAPFPFQNAYRNLRETYHDVLGAQVPVEEIQGPVVLRNLEAALDVFPWDDFPDFAPRVAPFRGVMLYLIEQNLEGLGLAREASEGFWFAFCYYLRLHPKAHFNVPADSLSYWRAALDDHINHYEVSFESLLLEVAETFPSAKHDARTGELVALAKKRSDETAKAIRDFESDLEDMGKFMKAMRQMRESAEG